MEKNTDSNEITELKRGIKGWQVLFIGVGGVIGSCYFLGLGAMIHYMGPAVILAFAVVGVVVYGLMIAYAELLVNVPRKGSFVAYVDEFVGETPAVASGWTFWFGWVVYVPSEAIAVAIVLHRFFPGNMAAYAIGALAVLTFINLAAVNVFAKVESWLTIGKIAVIFLFIITAFGIWIGLWGSEGFLGAQINFGSGNLPADMFPKGFVVVLTSMVIVLVTFQGTELVGLAASESQNPDVSVPKACKSVVFRIIYLYILPIAMIILVFPYGDSTLDDSIFAQVASHYNMPPLLTGIMSSVVLIAAFSCANSGFYGTVRCMYGLSIEGLAPKILSRLSKKASPKNSVLLTLAAIWIVLLIGLFAGESHAYAELLALSGFTGTFAWVGIILSQISFRRRLKKRGYDPYKCLKAKVTKGQSWLPWFALIVQIICLIMMAFSEDGLIVFAIAFLAFLIPSVLHIILRKAGKEMVVTPMERNEKSFDELFPPLK
jgi:AAT family amino acid transporter